MKEQFSICSLLLGFLLFCSLVPYSPYAEVGSLSANTEEILSAIPAEDRFELEQLFIKLFLNDHFGYTLLGGKAISLTGVVQEVEWPDLLAGSRKGRVFWKHWDTWSKYKPLFSMPNYLFLKEDSKVVDGVTWIILINKQKFKETVDENILTFREKLGDVNTESLLSSLETGKTSLQQLIRGNETLLGILLGYGELNSRKYEKRALVVKKLCASAFILSSYHDNMATDPTQLNHGSFQPSNQPSYILKVNPVSFCGDPSDWETAYLEKCYQKFNEKLAELYKDGKVFETTLSILSGSTIN